MVCLTNNQLSILIFNKIRWLLDMKNYSRFAFYMPVLFFQDRGLMAPVSYISFELLNKDCLSIIHPNPLTANYLHKFIRYVTHCRVCFKFSKRSVHSILVFLKLSRCSHFVLIIVSVYFYRKNSLLHHACYSKSRQTVRIMQ